MNSTKSVKSCSVISVDDEWLNFLNKTEDDTNIEYENYEKTCNNSSYCGSNYCSSVFGGDDNDTRSECGDYSEYSDNNSEYGGDYISLSELSEERKIAPISSLIHISTKSKIAYLNKGIDLKNVFWKIPIMPYSTAEDGIIKKQMKFSSMTEEELNDIKENLKNEVYFQEHVITSINNPEGRIKFKDIRKVSIGISKKDIMTRRAKIKSAFYNCFVMIMRLKIDETFREFNIKVFNTGKLEIPGVQTDDMFKAVLLNIIRILNPFCRETNLPPCAQIKIPISNSNKLNDDFCELPQDPNLDDICPCPCPCPCLEDEKKEIIELDYLKKSDTILINSNFNCGFYINREEFVDILKFKYNIHCIYDPTSYPGIQCKFYYDPVNKTHTSAGSQEMHKMAGIIEVSFMIFRTGSILIVGMCEEYVLHIIYEFLTQILTEEYHTICQKNGGEFMIAKKKPKKIRKRNITVSILPSITEDDDDVEADVVVQEITT